MPITITKERLKREIDQVQEEYFDVLYQIIQVFEFPGRTAESSPEKLIEQDRLEWSAFIEQTYGCLADDPIERGDQGVYAPRN